MNSQLIRYNTVERDEIYSSGQVSLVTTFSLTEKVKIPTLLNGTKHVERLLCRLIMDGIFHHIQ